MSDWKKILDYYMQNVEILYPSMEAHYEPEAHVLRVEPRELSEEDKKFLEAHENLHLNYLLVHKPMPSTAKH